MNKNIQTKQKIISRLIEIVDERINSAKQSIESSKESRDNETKSSVGDKYETGRAMMQFELEKNQVQLTKAKNLKNELSKINIQNKSDKVEFGSLVITNRGNYFISIAFGKIAIENTDFFCLSIASPIGKILHKKTIGENILFRNEKLEIIDII